MIQGDDDPLVVPLKLAGYDTFETLIAYYRKRKLIQATLLDIM
jgi:hypothetical protein